MYKNCFLPLVITIIISSCLLRSQSFSVKNYTEESGLETQNVNAAAQDMQGRMWFATGKGVSVYDGLSWKNYAPSDGLPKENYSKLIIDDNGTVWAFPKFLSKQAMYFAKGKWNRLPVANIRGVDTSEINSLAFIRSGKVIILCAGTHNGAFYFKDNTWNKLSANNGLLSNFVISLSSDSQKFYIATSAGLSVFDGNRVDNSLNLALKNKKNLLATKPIKDEAGKETLWLLGQTWVGSISAGKLSCVKTKFDLHGLFEDDHILFEVSHRDRIYFGNKFAKFVMNKYTGRISPLLKDNGFSSNTATSVFVDKEDNVWFTDLRGIDKLNNFMFRNYYTSTGLLSDEVTSLCDLGNGNYAFGHPAGLTILRDGKYKHIRFSDFNISLFSYQRVLDLAKDKHGNIWEAVSHQGICKVSPSGSIKWIKSKKNESFSSVLVTPDGILWAVSDKGLYKIIDDRLNKIPETLTHNADFRKIFSFGNNDIYFTSFHGVLNFRNGKCKDLFDSVNIHNFSRSVFCLLKLDKNSFLIGAEDGLFLLKNKTYTKVNINGVTINRPVFALTKDKRGNIFIGTNEGFLKWEPGDILHVFNISNGLAGREINRSAFLIDQHSDLWVGTDRGLSRFSGDNFRINTPLPTIELKTIELANGTTFPLTHNIKLDSDQNSFFVSFCGISFIDEKAIEYKIKLEGFDKDWIKISQAQIGKFRYTNLPYGSFRLVVMAHNKGGKWSKPLYSGFIDINKPFYFQWWFIVIISLAELLILYSAYRFFLLRTYNSSLEEQVSLKTARLMDSEHKLRIAYDELEQRVEERTIELAEANKKLKKLAEEQIELNAYKDKFFSIIAHDLKSPFQGLLGISSILIDEFDNLSREHIKRFLLVLKNSTQNVYGLIENLLQWSRLQTGKMPYEPETLNLYEEAAYVKNLLSLNTAGKNLELKIEIPEDIFVFTDKKMLQSILQNLGSNAIKFSNPGGEIEIIAKEEEDFVEVTVKDYGVGIEPEVIANLFNTNNQHTTKGTNEEEGTGLGLAISSEMVKKQKGEIRVESIYGKGSSFIFTVPKPVLETGAGI